MPQYWLSIERVLRKEGVADTKIRRLELQIIKAGQQGTTLKKEGLETTLGVALKTGALIAGLADKLLGLWHHFG